MSSGKIKDWILAFAKVAAARLDQRNYGNGSENLEIDIKKCIREENCLLLRIGEIIDHVPCSSGDPYEVARAVLQKMLPIVSCQSEQDAQAIEEKMCRSSGVGGFAVQTGLFEPIGERSPWIPIMTKPAIQSLSSLQPANCGDSLASTGTKTEPVNAGAAGPCPSRDYGPEEFGQEFDLGYDADGYQHKEKVAAISRCPRCHKEVALVAETEEWEQRDDATWEHVGWGPASGVCCDNLIVESSNGHDVYPLPPKEMARNWTDFPVGANAPNDIRNTPTASGK